MAFEKPSEVLHGAEWIRDPTLRLDRMIVTIFSKVTSSSIGSVIARFSGMPNSKLRY